MGRRSSASSTTIPYAEILGAKHPRALGRRFHDIWSEIWPDISPLIDAAMAGQATYREDLPLVMNRKGYDEQTWFTFSYSPVRDESGKVAGMFCACSETTARGCSRERALRELNETLERRVNEALAERKLLADIVEGTNAFVQVADLDYRWLAINRAAADEFERIFGMRPRVGDSMLDLLASQPEHQAAVKAVWSRALAGEEFTVVEEFGDPARDRRAYEMRYNTLRDRDGNRIGAYQFVYDVTERLRDQERLRRAEEALRQAQKMESIGQLTGGVAHDFNNLLAVFASGLQLLERNVTPEQRQRVFEGMRRAVARGTGLTHHLLAFSRRRPVNPESIDLAAHLDGHARDARPARCGGDIHVEMKFDADLWPVEIDAGELELAMLNLCVNARDAMAGGGDHHHHRRERAGSRTSVAARLTSSSSRWPTRAAECRPRCSRRAFEPFFTTKDVGKGSGLGLPQVYGFAQQSGGRRHDRQRGRRGHDRDAAAASLVAAAGRASPMPTISDRAVGARSGERRGQVLLVEDDKEVAALTREMLSTLGFTVIHVGKCRRGAGRAGQCALRRRRALRHHDAGRHERPRARSRDPAAAAEPARRAHHRLRRSGGRHERRRIRTAPEAVQRRSAGRCAGRRGESRHLSCVLRVDHDPGRSNTGDREVHLIDRQSTAFSQASRKSSSSCITKSSPVANRVPTP